MAVIGITGFNYPNKNKAGNVDLKRRLNGEAVKLPLPREVPAKSSSNRVSGLEIEAFTSIAMSIFEIFQRQQLLVFFIVNDVTADSPSSRAFPKDFPSLPPPCSSSRS